MARLEWALTGLKDFIGTVPHKGTCGLLTTRYKKCDCGRNKVLDAVTTALSGSALSPAAPPAATTMIRDKDGALQKIERSLHGQMVRDVALFMVQCEKDWALVPGGRDCLRDVWGLACRMRESYAADVWDSDDDLIGEARWLVNGGSEGLVAPPAGGGGVDQTKAPHSYYWPRARDVRYCRYCGHAEGNSDSGCDFAPPTPSQKEEEG